jgi:DNA-binding NarL/FixJ family response regulator
VDLGRSEPAELAELSSLARDEPALGLVVLSDPGAVRHLPALSRGRVGYLPRDAAPSAIVHAIHSVAAGLVVLAPETVPALVAAPRPADEPPAEALTSRELEVLALLAQGLPNKTIAHRLTISEHTVKFHVGAILAKLGAASRTEAVMLAARQGLLML